MKLVFTIVSNDDSALLISALVEAKYSVTKLSTTGGFLKSGNTTLLIGTEEKEVDKVISIIKSYSKKRVQPMPVISSKEFGMISSQFIDVQVGGATIFVLDVDRYEKV
jgi:uncharacterized protein YaaQ